MELNAGRIALPLAQGDRVRCKDADATGGRLKVGEVYTVGFKYQDGEGREVVSLFPPPDYTGSGLFLAERFERVTDPIFVEGDLERMIGSAQGVHGGAWETQAAAAMRAALDSIRRLRAELEREKLLALNTETARFSQGKAAGRAEAIDAIEARVRMNTGDPNWRGVVNPYTEAIAHARAQFRPTPHPTCQRPDACSCVLRCALAYGEIEP